MSNRFRWCAPAVMLTAGGLAVVCAFSRAAIAADAPTAEAVASIAAAVDWLGGEIRIEPKSTVKVDAAAADALPVKELIVRARLDLPRLEAADPTLQVKVNGIVLDFDRIRNRPRRISFNKGRLQKGSCMLGNVWTIFYSPNFDPIPVDSEFAPVGIDPYDLRFDVSDLWKNGKKNDVELIEAYLGGYAVVAKVGVSETLSPSMLQTRRPAPDGPIPTIEPITDARPDYSWRQLPGGAIELKLGDQQWIIESRFSTLAPGWANLAEVQAPAPQWSSLQLDNDGLRARTKDFELQRTINRCDDRLQVIDRVANISDQDLPVMFAHQTRVDRKNGTLYIAGLPAPHKKLDSNDGAHPNGDHPTTLMTWEKSGLGFVGEDDVTRAQGVNFVDDDVIGIRDDRLVVARGGSVELEFSVYPLDSGDRFAFINRVRRNWNTNFTIQGSEWQESSYTPPGMYMDMTDAQLEAQLRNRAVRYLLGCVWSFNFEGLSTELTPHNDASLKMLNRAKAVRPDLQRMVYFHAYLGNQDTRALEADPNIAEVERRLFKQDRIERADGSPFDYSTGMPLFLPVEGSTWAHAQERQLEYILDRTGAEGVFWDETAYSANAYDYNPNHWDGVSAEIDPQSHRIKRKVTNLILATQPWRLKVAERLLSRGPLRGNGPPQTRSFTRLHFPRNVETWTFSSVPRSQLYTPIGMGDHMFERNEVDAYQDMVDGLDHGAVYYWYSTAIETTRTTLTSFMFPITPINLGEGYIIARERILTNRSGYFGWGDGSDFDVVVFDDRGDRTEKIKTPKVERNGKTFAEIRIPEGYSAALIRK